MNLARNFLNFSKTSSFAELIIAKKKKKKADARKTQPKARFIYQTLQIISPKLNTFWKLSKLKTKLKLNYTERELF